MAQTGEDDRGPQQRPESGSGDGPGPAQTPRAEGPPPLWAAPPGEPAGASPQEGPPSPPTYPVGGYGPTAYSPPPLAGRPNAGGAVAVAVLGIGSLVVLFTCLIGFIPAIIALVMAPNARREIEQSGGRLGGEGLIQAGKICSWITLGLTALLLVVVLVAVVAIVVSVESGGSSTPALGL
jgi:hypothetical protein